MKSNHCYCDSNFTAVCFGVIWNLIRRILCSQSAVTETPKIRKSTELIMCVTCTMINFNWYVSPLLALTSHHSNTYARLVSRFRSNSYSQAILFCRSQSNTMQRQLQRDYFFCSEKWFHIFATKQLHGRAMCTLYVVRVCIRCRSGCAVCARALVYRSCDVWSWWVNRSHIIHR